MLSDLCHGIFCVRDEIGFPGCAVADGLGLAGQGDAEPQSQGSLYPARRPVRRAVRVVASRTRMVDGWDHGRVRDRGGRDAVRLDSDPGDD